MDVTEIGNRIKKRRTALGMTQKDLAKEMSVSNQLISKWETGESVPSLEYLDALCKALKVDYPYFTSDSETEAEKPEAVQPATAKSKKAFKWNWKLFIIIACSVFAAAFIAGFSCLTVYVFVPMANRTNYINEIEKAYENYFALGYYSINEKSELDGDVKDDYRYDGYFDENGKPVFYDTKSKKTVKDDIATFDGGEYKYHYVSDKTYETVEELAVDKILSPDEDELGLWDDEILDKISYIRKVKGGYYLEFKDEYFTDELTGTQKKNFKLTEKIKGRIDIKDGLYSYMEVTVKYLNKPDNEHFTIKASFEFIAEKPVIEHKNLEEREWNGTYAGDKWYPPESPDVPVIDDTPKCEELLSTEDFISRLSGGKAQKLAKDFDFNKLVLNGEIKDGGDCYYYVDGNSVKLLSKNDLSVKNTVNLEGTQIANVYVYNGNIYWTSKVDYRVSLHVMNISSKKEETPFNYDTGNIIYNGGYALYYGSPSDTRYTAYIVCDLIKKQEIYSIKGNIYNPLYIDSAGNVYCNQFTAGNYFPVIYKNTSGLSINDKYTALKGKEYFRVSDGIYSSIYVDGDSICTYENDTVYLYEYGKLKETLTTSDPRFKENYTKLSTGYCITGTTSANIFDENGEKRTFETVKLKQKNGGWTTIYDYNTKDIVAVVNGKLIVATAHYGGYLAVYDESDLTKPLYYMEKPMNYNGYCEYGELEILHIGSKTIIAVRVNTADYYGYELYCF